MKKQQKKQPIKKLYQMGEVAEMLGVPYQTLYWAVRMGLTKPFQSERGTAKLFNDEHVAELRAYFDGMKAKAEKYRKENSMEAVSKKVDATMAKMFGNKNKKGAK